MSNTATVVNKTLTDPNAPLAGQFFDSLLTAPAVDGDSFVVAAASREEFNARFAAMRAFAKAVASPAA